MENLFLDSGIFIKIFDTHNWGCEKYNHEQIYEIYISLLPKYEFITINLIIAESLNFITKLIFKKNTPYDIDHLIKFCFNYIDSNLHIRYLDDKHHERALEIIKEFRQFKYSYADAASLAFIEDMEGIPTFTIDGKWRYFTFFKGHEYSNLDVIDII